MLEILIQIFIKRTSLRNSGNENIKTAYEHDKKYKETYMSNESDECYKLVLKAYDIFERMFGLPDGHRVNQSN